MYESWRWYGHLDKVKLSEIKQTGATNIVTALHEIPYGEVWDRSEIAHRRAEIEEAGFRWSVCESLPVSENIKRGTGKISEHFAAYRNSMANLAAEGVSAIVYNFMPLLDWTRTDLKAPVPGGGTCLRFDMCKMAAFDVYMVGRPGSESEYTEEILQKAQIWHQAATETDRNTLLSAIMTGMPGAFERYDIDGHRKLMHRSR